MKRSIILVLIAILFNSFLVKGQIKYLELSKLESTAKIWGFLKYYHPEVASGSLDWDNKLFEILKEIDGVKTVDALSQVYLKYINALGEIKPCKKCKSNIEYFDKNFDLSWIENDKNFNQKLVDILRNIENNRFQGDHYYVTYGKYNEFSIVNESTYSDLNYTKNHNLLSLFRYWNIIEYFYPYKYLLDQKWDAVLREMIPIFSKANNSKELEYAIKRLVAKVDDTHAWVRFDNKRNKRFPYKIKNIQDSCVVAGFFNKEIAVEEGLHLGDIILKIESKSIYDVVNDSLNITPASNPNRKILSAYSKILNASQESLNLEIKRGDSIFNKVVTKYDFNDFNYYNPSNEKPWKLINENIGYVNMRLLSVNEVDEAMKMLLNAKGIIFDLRSYPKFNLYEIGQFLNSEKKIFAKSLNPVLSYPGKFVWGKYPLKIGPKKNNNPYKGDIIILVDGQSLSRSEFTAMGLRTANNAVIVGSQTAGADGTATSFKFPRGYTTGISGSGIYYPDGKESQRMGVKIDVKVIPTVQGLRQGKDEYLEEALKIIEN